MPKPTHFVPDETPQYTHFVPDEGAQTAGPQNASEQQPGFLENLGHTFGIGRDEAQQQQQEFNAHPIRNILGTATGIKPVADLASGLWSGGKRIAGELGQAGNAALHGDASGTLAHGVNAIPFVGPAMQKMEAEAPATHPSQSWLEQAKTLATPGNLGTAVGTAAQTAPMLLGGADTIAPARPQFLPIGSAIRNAAIGNPDVPLTRGLGITARTKTGLSALRSAGEAAPNDVSLEEAQGARPYGQGAKNLADLQDKLTRARTEINQPLNRALGATANKRVMGPDGPTTIQGLEAERVQLSAQLRGLQQRDPLTVQTALQKGLGEADLKNRYDAVVDAMTPHLDATGIDSRAIRMQDAQVASTLGKVAGLTTLPEEPRPYGFGKLQNIANFGGGNTAFDLLKPAKTIGNAFRDVVAGKPLWSGRPTDVNIQQGFSSAGPKPLLDTFNATKAAQSMGAFNSPPRLLESDVPGNAPYGEEPYAGSMNGTQERNPVRITPPSPRRLGLPSSSSSGEAQPMIRYATPYTEPYDPHLIPFSQPEYLNSGKPHNSPLVPKPPNPSQPEGPSLSIKSLKMPNGDRLMLAIDPNGQPPGTDFYHFRGSMGAYPPGILEQEGVDPNSVIGYTNLSKAKLGGLVPKNTEVLPAYRRQGIASRLYNQAEQEEGQKISPAWSQTPDAKAFWKTRKKEQ
jgi:hypothetical protein